MVTTKKASAKGSAKASVKSAAATSSKTLTVSAGPKARFASVALQLEKAFKRGGCPGCRSGIDRIVFEDPALPSIK